MTKYENIWNMLKSYNFELNDEIRKNFLCTICKRILIDACNASCGCRYCSHCLINYLDGTEKRCPGTSNDCHDKLINIDDSIQLDQAVNFQISKLIVKCPVVLCDFRDELRNMSTHLQTCNEQSIVCPFISIGCRQIGSLSGKLATHLSDETLVHSQLIAQCIDKLTNEMIILRNNNDELKQINNDLSGTIETIVNENAAKQMCISTYETNEKLKLSQIFHFDQAFLDDKQENGVIPIAHSKIELIQRSQIEKYHLEIDDLKNEVKTLKTEIENFKKLSLTNKQLELLPAEVAKLKLEISKEKRKYLKKIRKICTKPALLSDVFMAGFDGSRIFVNQKYNSLNTNRN